MPQAGGELKSVRIRRATSIRGLAFDTESNLIFSAKGDLWSGSLENDEEEGGTLCGFRYAPIALRETGITTTASSGAHRLAIAGDWVYVHYTRLGGSGWGSIVRVKRPPREGTISLDDQTLWKTTSLVIASTEKIAEAEHCFLCTSPDEKRAFYLIRGEAPEAYLIGEDGKPARLTIKNLTEALTR